MNLKPSGLTPLEVTNALNEKDLNQAAISRALGLTPGHISAVIARKRPSRRVDEAIAEAIGMDKKKIWPDRYLSEQVFTKGRPKKEWRRRAAA